MVWVYCICHLPKTINHSTIINTSRDASSTIPGSYSIHSPRSCFLVCPSDACSATKAWNPQCACRNNLQQTSTPVPRKKKKTEDTLHGSTVHNPPVMVVLSIWYLKYVQNDHVPNRFSVNNLQYRRLKWWKQKHVLCMIPTLTQQGRKTCIVSTVYKHVHVKIFIQVNNHKNKFSNSREDQTQINIITWKT